MIARIIAREFHGRSYVVWIVKQHHIKAKERFHEIAIKYGTVLAIAFGIIEQLFGEERLFVAELLGVGGILKSILAEIEKDVGSVLFILALDGWP